MKRLKLFILSLLSLLSFNVNAQSLIVDGEKNNWEINLNFGLNTDGYNLDLGVAYFPNQFVGVKVSIGMVGEIPEYRDWDDWDDDYYWDDLIVDGGVKRFKFNPAVVFRSPCLIKWRNGTGGMFLFAEPGMILSPGACDSYHSRPCSWDVKCGLNFQFGRFIATLGYNVSNYYLYSGLDSVRDTGDFITHGGYIGCGFKF